MDLINLIIDPNPADRSGVSAIALVDSPAIEEGWIAFNKQSGRVLKKYTIQLGGQKGDFKPIDSDKQIVAGALMVPDKKIYRRDTDGREYEVEFTPETIRLIQEKFASSNRNTAINEMHNADAPVQAALIQHFIIDRTAGILPPLGQDHLPDGTWYGYVKINDKKKWDEYIKTGTYTGFSVEGHFYEEPKTKEDDYLSDLFDHLIDSIK